MGKRNRNYPIFGFGDIILYLFEKKLKIKLPLSSKIRWKWSIKSEIRYWDRWLAAKGLDLPNEDDYGIRVSKNLQLEEEIVSLLPDKQNVTILDVGAGPMTTLGKVYKNLKINIIAIDPLADEYNKLLKKYKIVPIVRTIKLDVMKLTNKFSPNSFDLVFAKNCIDHTYSPEKAILQMINVVKKNHYVFLKHKPNEAINQKWKGMHQWNFSLKGSDFIISSKNETINFSNKYIDMCEIKCTYDTEENYIITSILKK